MPARKLQFVQGAYYHIYNRGAARQTIFRDGTDYEVVLRQMKEYAAKYDHAIIAYCLMPNHYHWLVRQDGPVVARMLPQHVFNRYSKIFNRKYDCNGTLFETRFQAKAVETDEYLRHLCRYIHGNPVKDNIADAPDLWPYSNYLEWIGKRNGSLVERIFIQAHFADSRQYKSFVLDWLAGKSKMPEPLAHYLLELEGN